MKMTMKLVFGIVLVSSFFSLYSMEVQVDADAKKADGIGAKGILPQRRSRGSSDSKFAMAKGSLKGVSDDVILAHGEAVGKYQDSLEDGDGALLTFKTLKDQKKVQAITKARDELYRRLDALRPNEFVLVVKGLHEAVFKAGNVEKLVKHDKDVKETSKQMPLSYGLVVMWADEYFVIERLREMAASMKAGTWVVPAEGEVDPHQKAIKERLANCIFVDSIDKTVKTVKHTKFTEDVTLLFELVENFVSESSGDAEDAEGDAKLLAALAEQLSDGAASLARTYLVPVL